MRLKFFIVASAFAASVLCASGQTKTYNGSYPNLFDEYGILAANTRASYSYREDGEKRIYDGPFNYTFKAYGANNKTGSLKGNFKDNVPVGEWVLEYPCIDAPSDWITVKFTINEKGLPDGPASYTCYRLRKGAKVPVAEVKLNYVNGNLNGKCSMSAPETAYMEKCNISGQYVDGDKSGVWEGTIGTGTDNMFKIKFVNDQAVAAVKIDRATGDTYEDDDIWSDADYCIGSMDTCGKMSLVPMSSVLELIYNIRSNRASGSGWDSM